MDVARRVQAGEVFDVVVPAADAIDQFVTNATLLAGSRVDLAKSGVAIAVTAGASVPGVAPKTP